MVNTEYHLILSIGIMKDFLDKGYEVVMFRVSPIGGNRLNNLDISCLPVKYEEIIYDYGRPTRELKDRIDLIINNKLDYFFFFLENKYWFNYLFRGLHHNHTTIALAPDGMNAYENYCYSLRDRLKNFYRGLFQSIRMGLFSFPYVERDFAKSKYIDEVWVEYPEFFNNSNNKRVVEFHVEYNEVFLSSLNKVFGFCSSTSEIDPGSIIYIDSSYGTDVYYERVVDLIQKLKGKDQNKKIYIKLHQQSNIEKAKSYYNRLGNIVFLVTKYPAELYIANCSNTIIVSLISTSMMLYNPTCTYYWIYPLFADMFNYKRVVNPTNFIKVISDSNQLQSGK